ncbi:MAG TPA: N-methyl-L-tryptophan oxidase [Chitinophagaceae bacterium]|nr:N-methyl-L-tryptophan oxidase [Chitinophagaceae bacterium]
MDQQSSNQNNLHFDVIVIGVGSMGSSACYHLAREGYKVLGLEKFKIGHENGAHTGQSRIIRKAYFEAPEYVPLLETAYKNWKELEDKTGEQLYFPTGLLYIGQPDHILIRGMKQSAALYQVPIENLSAKETRKRFPAFHLPPGFEIVHEPDAGFIPPEKAIRLYAEQAQLAGAEIHTKENVMRWELKGNHCVVTTGKREYKCNKLVITTGPWSRKMIPAIENKLLITRQFIAWVKMKKEQSFALGNFPCWMIADDERPGSYYGFPALPTEKFGEPGGMKMAHHFPGQAADPDQVNRQATPEDEQNIEYALHKYFPGSYEAIHSSKTCLYANSPDENFIVDHLPGYDERVVIGCGFSGHGFKFVSLVGQVLADLAMKGKTDAAIDFLKLNRFANSVF